MARKLNFCRRSWWRVCASAAMALCFATALAPAQVSPKLKAAEQLKQKSSGLAQAGAAAQVTTVPNLAWTPRNLVLRVLTSAHLRPGAVKDEGGENSVVIWQSLAPGSQVVVGTAVDYTVGQPAVSLDVRPSAEIKLGTAVRLEAKLNPPLPQAPASTPPTAMVYNPAASPPTYIFSFGDGPQGPASLDPTTEHAYKTRDTYEAAVTVRVRGMVLTGKQTIRVTAVQAETSPTASPKTPTPRKRPSPERSQTPILPPADTRRNPQWIAIVVLLGVLAAAGGAYFFWPKAVSSPVRVSVGSIKGRYEVIHSERMKAKCLFRVRWVRSPITATMQPPGNIIKKKGASHA